MAVMSSFVVDKIWGREVIFADQDNYCGKLLIFDNEGSSCSMHFHAIKDETWYVQKGSFRVDWIDTKDAKTHSEVLRVGDVWHNPPLFPHRLTALQDDSVIFESSTEDSESDNYRIAPGKAK